MYFSTASRAKLRNAWSSIGERAVPVICNAGSSSPSAWSAHSEGNSMRWDRSPVAPNSSSESALDVMRYLPSPVSGNIADAALR
jgi:hypothetical protein